MTTWSVQQELISPVRALQNRLIPASVEVRLQLVPVANPLAMPDTLASACPEKWQVALATVGVALGATPRIEIKPAVPSPWQAKPLDSARLIASELLRGLLFVPEGGPYPSLEADIPVPTSADLREGLALALVRLSPPLDFRTKLLHQWQTDFSNVMFERTHHTVNERPGSFPLLTQGTRLLGMLVRLRNTTLTLADYDSRLAELEGQEPLPFAFRIMFWWEATYRLTESGDFESAEIAHQRTFALAEALKARLPGMADEVDVCVLGLQHGRLAYYKGDFPLALLCFSLEWKSLRAGREASTRPYHTHEARLLREAANVFTDLGYLDTAKFLIQSSLSLQEPMDPERFKSLGRMAEILLRSGDPEGAAKQYECSLTLQTTDKLPLDQTLTYLGHAALLAGRLADAESCYGRATDAMATSPANGSAPYLWMGQVALARAQGNSASLRQLAESYSTFADLKGPRVLPRAVGAAGLWFSGLLANEDMDREIDALYASSYFLEALYPLSLRHEHPDSCRDRLLKSRNELRLWQDAAANAGPLNPLGDLPGKNPLGVSHYATAIDLALTSNDWSPLHALAKRIHPFHLLS